MRSGSLTVTLAFPRTSHFASPFDVSLIHLTLVSFAHARVRRGYPTQGPYVNTLSAFLSRFQRVSPRSLPSSIASTNLGVLQNSLQVSRKLDYLHILLRSTHRPQVPLFVDTHESFVLEMLQKDS